MLRIFENMAKANPRSLCFTFINAANQRTSYSYHRARLHASAIAQVLRASGVQRGSLVALELGNHEAWPLLLLAAAYGNFCLVALDPHLTIAEKTARVTEIESVPNTVISCFINQDNVDDLLLHARSVIDGEQPLLLNKVYGTANGFSANAASLYDSGFFSSAGVSANKNAKARTGSHATSFFTQAGMLKSTAQMPSKAHINKHEGVRASQSSGPSNQPLKEALPPGFDITKLPPSQLRRYATEAEESVVHFADHAAHLFDNTKPAVVLFTAGASGKSKVVCLTWRNLAEAAKSLNSVVCANVRGVWQAVLPCYRIMGLQVIMRCVCNKSSFALYEQFQPDVLLDDVDALHITHIAVDDNMVSELLMCENQAALRRYTCLLLGGVALKHNVARACAKRNIRVYAGYGITETAGHIAIGRIDDAFDGSLELLPGYEVSIEQEAPSGFGRLLVRGSSVCDRYFGARTPLVRQGFFPTGDTAKFSEGRIVVRGRTNSMFLCAGNNVFPDEIRELLLAEQGVSDAYVFGAPDAKLGACAIAFIERNDKGQNPRLSNRRLTNRLRAHLAAKLAPSSVPRHIFALDSFPRTSAGRIDEALLERCCSERLEVAQVRLHRVCVPLTSSANIGGVVVKQRESLIVELIDYQGRSGVGECVAFSHDDAGFERLSEAQDYLQHVLAPHIIGQAFLHPGEVSACFLDCPGAHAHQRSCGTLEPAFWDLYGKISGLAFWQLIGGRPSNAEGSQCRVRAAAVIDVESVRNTVEHVWRCAEAGYSCVTINVRPGMAYERVRAVRQVFPHIMITLDAHGSFTEANIDELQKLDEFNIAWIEEPLMLTNSSLAKYGAGSSSIRAGTGANKREALTRRKLAQLSRCQQILHTPLCLDETIPTLHDAYLALEYPNLRYMVARVGEFGGVRPTLDFIRSAHARGVHIWIGGMHDLGISRKVHAALQTLPAVEDAGNTGSVLRQFASDIAFPAHTVERGLVTLNKTQMPCGIGCKLDKDALSRYLVKSIVVG